MKKDKTKEQLIDELKTFSLTELQHFVNGRHLVELEASQKRYKAIIETAIQAIVTIDDHGIIEAVNPATIELFGYSIQELIGKNINMLMPEPDHLEHDKKLQNYRKSGKAKIIGIGREVMGLKKDQSTFPLSLSITEIILDNKRKFTGTMRDLTQEKNKQQESVKLQRLRAVSELSVGICHNLNNMLMGIMGPAQILQMETANPKILEQANDILVASKRARDLVARLHESTKISTFTESELKPVDIEHLITEAIGQTRPKWKDEAESKGLKIDISTHLSSVSHIRAIPSNMSDILINMIINAVDAMPEGGKIFIGTKSNNQEVILTISDTGTGMDDETKLRIFEPFFTTKTDIGTGLGLSTTHNSITQFGGKIHVESEVNKGTTFRIHLPLWLEDIEKNESPSLQPGRSGKILIVEDDPTVQKVLSRMLSTHHTVDIFKNGERALSQFKSGHYDTAIIDLGLPEMPGNHIAHQMRHQDPCLATVLISGWSLNMNDPRLSDFDFHIQKPIDDIKGLLKTLNTAIQLHDKRSPR